MSKETQQTLRICSDNSVLRCPLSLFYHDMLHLALQHDHPARLLLLQFCVHEMVKDTLVPGDVGGGQKGHALLLCIGYDYMFSTIWNGCRDSPITSLQCACQ